MEKRRLGRGLETLIGGSDTAVAELPGENAGEVPLDRIQLNPFQPRKSFDKDELASLSASLKEHGVLQPVVVRIVGDHFQLVAGERRLRPPEVLGEELPDLVRIAVDLLLPKEHEVRLLLLHDRLETAGHEVARQIVGGQRIVREAREERALEHVAPFARDEVHPDAALLHFRRRGRRIDRHFLGCPEIR